MENHLIVGLGGTGGRVLAAYRKLVYERFSCLKPEGVWVDYLYVDSSASDLKMDEPKQWSTMGGSVKLSADSVVEIQAANLASYVNNRSRYAYLAPWLGNNDDWQRIINDPKIQDGAAGQKRRLGRLLFANGSTKFNTLIDSKVQELRKNPDGQRVTFHLVCGLAGGTGSGSIVDAIAQIRKAYPQSEDYKIMLYLLLPDEIPNKAWASTDNYQPNGYIALKELNALDFKKFKPWDVGERKIDVQQLDLDLPFYSAYLITEQNTENVAFDVQQVVPSSIAEFLFQKTIAIADVALTGNETESAREFFHSAERGENPDYKNYNGEQSHKFMTYGIKRLAIPEEEIKEFFGYSFTQQGIHSLLYKNLSAEKGYLNEPTITEDFSDYVSSRDISQKWCILRDYLCLSLLVLDEHKRDGWASIKETYAKEVDKILSITLEDDNIEFVDKLSAIENRTRAFFKKGFRSLNKEDGQGGVENFYALKRAHSIQPLCEYISSRIEEDLFTEWKNGARSILQVDGLLSALLRHLSKECDNLNNLKSNAQTELKKIEREIDGRKRDWANTGFFSKLGKKTGWGSTVDTNAQEFAICVKNKYMMMTWLYGYDFAIDLINNLIASIKLIQENVQAVITNLSLCANKVNAEVLSRCNEEPEAIQSRNGMVIKHYDANKVYTLCNRAINVSDINEANVDTFRANLVARLNSEKRTFGEVRQKLTVSQIMEVVDFVGNDLANKFFENKSVAEKIPAYSKLIGVNIIEKLREEYDGNSNGLKKLFETLVRHAAVMAKHNDTEVNDGDGAGIKQSTFIIVPEFKEDEKFFKVVIDSIKEAAARSNVKVSVGGRSNEIVVINLEANITPRYLTSVKVLRDAQERLFNSAYAKVAQFETQLEDYGELPDLFKEDDATKAKKEREARINAVPILLFAKGMNILIEKKDSETGKTVLQFVPKDEDGLPDFDKAIKLGKSIEKSIDKIDTSKMAALEEAVENSFKSEYKHISKLDELRKNIALEVKNIMIAHNNDLNDEMVQIFNRAFKEVKTKIEQQKAD